MLSLVELCARQVAAHIPFEVVERVYPPVPEQIQLRITYWSFPDSEEDIRLYSCLANGSADEFSKGENLFRLVGADIGLIRPFLISFSPAVRPPSFGLGRGPTTSPGLEMVRTGGKELNSNRTNKQTSDPQFGASNRSLRLSYPHVIPHPPTPYVIRA